MLPDLLLQSLPTAACTQDGGCFYSSKGTHTHGTSPGPQPSPDKETEALGGGAQVLTGSSRTRIRTQEAGLQSVPQPQALPRPHFQRRIHTHSLVQPPPTPGGTSMPIPRTRMLGYSVVEGLTQGHTVIRIHKVSNPSHLPIVIIHSTSQSCLLPHHQCSKGREGERKGKGEEGRPPSPQRAPFWSGERPLMKAPQMPLSWRCQPGSPAEMQGEHLCSQLAHRSSIKAHACCQEQRPEGRPF